MPRSQTPLARRTVRRFLDALPTRSGGGDGPDVDKLRQQLRRSRRNLKKSEAAVERLRREIRLTRASLRDPFPDTAVRSREHSDRGSS